MQKPTVTRILPDHDPDLKPGYIFASYPWPAWWIAGNGWDGHTPVVWAFRRRVELAVAGVFRIHVSADQRYDLYLDGERIGWGPERGDPACWFYETYDLHLPAGAHTLVARVWWGGKGVLAPYAHMTAEPAFMVYGEGAANDLFTTGVAEWEVLPVAGMAFVPPQVRDSFCVSGGRVEIEGSAFSWDYEKGGGYGWQTPRKVLGANLRAQGNSAPYQWWLRHAMLPPMFEGAVTGGRVRWAGAVWDEATPLRAADSLDAEAARFDAWVKGGAPLRVEADAVRHVLVDLGDYVCGWASVTCSGGAGASIRVRWAESLFTEQRWFEKGNRDEIEGKYFRGLYDTYFCDGGKNRFFEPPWWTAGRYLLVSIETAGEPLVLEKFHIRETHYPYRFEAVFNADDTRWNDVAPLAKRVLEMCSHESYMDCPYYEQLMYAGDTRLEVLATYALTRDDRLPQKAIWMFDLSRRDSGFTTARYPTREKQVIPPFSLWWVMMVHDALMWRGDQEFVRARLPGVRAVLEGFRIYVGDDGLLHAPKGWNFVDWPGWPKGMPPGAESGVNATLNLHACLTFAAAAELEDWAGEPLLAQRNRELAARLAASAERVFWDEPRGLFAEDAEHTAFAEHAQYMAMLCGFFDHKAAGLIDRIVSLSDSEITRATIYFSFYLFEAFARHKALDRAYPRFDLWFGLRANGFRTTPEKPEPTRSDCHAWGAHPMFHVFASLCGIRPAAPAFERVRIAPQPCGNKTLRATMPHPNGDITVDLALGGNGGWTGTLATPEGVPAEALLPDGRTLKWDGGAFRV